MSKLLREAAQGLLKLAQDSTDERHCAVLVLILDEDGGCQELCWADEGAAEIAIQHLPEAAQRMAQSLSEETGRSIEPLDTATTTIQPTNPADLMVAERMTRQVIGRAKGATT